MKKQVDVICNEISHLTDKAESLIDTARDGISEQVEAASNHFAAGRERGKDLARFVRNKGIECGSAVDQELHDHSFRYLAIVAGIGALLGYLLTSRCACNRPSCK